MRKILVDESILDFIIHDPVKEPEELNPQTFANMEIEEFFNEAEKDEQNRVQEEV